MARPPPPPTGDKQEQAPTSTRGRRQQQLPSVWEWITAAIGLALLLATLAYLGLHALDGEKRAPAPVAQVLAIERQQQGWLVRIRVRNHGTEVAARLVLSGTLRQGAQVLEESQVEFQYLPGGASREGGLFFRRDPAQLQLELAPRSYEAP